jgi:hypothetical protein
MFKGIQKVRFYTSLCQESLLLSHLVNTNYSESIRRLLCPISSFLIENMKMYLHSDSLDYHSEGLSNQVNFNAIHSHLGTSETLKFNARFIFPAHDRRIESLNDFRSTTDDKGSERGVKSFQANVEV